MATAVLIPVYNHAAYLEETIGSCLEQTAPPDRILLIDDGSSDGSVPLCQTFADAHPGLVKLRARENRGAHETINELVRWAAEEGCTYANILNSDDRLKPRRLEACRALLDSSPHPQVAASAIEVIGADSATAAADDPRARWFHAAWSAGTAADGTPLSTAEWLGRANFVATTTNVFARLPYLLENPFRPYRYNHDYFFLACAAVRDLIVTTPEALVCYRIHGSNTITTAPAPLMREMLRMMLDLHRHLAPELFAGPEAPLRRRRFGSFVESAWDNISAFSGIAHTAALAHLLHDHVSAEEVAEAVATLEIPELESFPNKERTNRWDGTSPLFAERALAEKLAQLRAENRELKASLASTKAELKSARASLGSRAQALQRLLGLRPR